MSPILGIIASANYPRSTNSYESIATVTVGSGGSSSITFSSIPSTYQHLQVRFMARSTSATASDIVVFRFNGTGSTTSIHTLTGDGSSAYATATTSYSYGGAGSIAANSSTASAFGAGVFDLLDYADVNKYKTTRTLTGYDANGSGLIRLSSSLIQTTSAISSITFTTDNAANFAEYSSFALYGIKG